jgi:hypothetical protein
MNDHPSRFALVQWRVRDLPADEMRNVEDHLARCPACRDALDAIAVVTEEQEARLEERLAEFDARLDAAIGRRRRSVFAAVGGALGLAACAAVALGIGLAPGDPERSPEALAYTGLKGEMKFQVVAKRGGNQFRVERDAELRENDALRFVVITDGGGFVEVFSVDSGGAVSPFYPDTEPIGDPSPLRIDGLGRHELPGSIVLDDASGHEFYVVVFSSEEFDRGKIHEWASETRFDEQPLDLGDLGTGPELSIGVLRVRKR